MKHTYLLSAALILSGLLAAVSAADAPKTPGYVEGEAIVCISQGDAALLSDDDPFAALLNHAEVLFDGANTSGDASLSAESGYRIAVVKDAGRTTDELIQGLSALPNVTYAGPNRLYALSENEDVDMDVDPLFPYEPFYLTDDRTGSQWTYNGEFGVDIPHWNEPEYINSDGVIALLDTGVDYTNPDLVDAMWDKGLEYPALVEYGGGKYGCTVGDVVTPDGFDTLGHGTHCAGIMVGAWNGFGISGAANGAKLMTVGIAVENDSLRESNILKGFAYILLAKQSGVDVVAVNNSWGTTGAYSPCIDIAVRELGKAGVVCVFAAGNDATDLGEFADSSSTFKYNPYTVIVNATDKNGALCYFSNYGKSHTDLAAPGGSILSTVTEENSSNNAGTPSAVEDFEDDELCLTVTPSENVTVVTEARPSDDSLSLRFDGEMIAFDVSPSDAIFAKTRRTGSLFITFEIDKNAEDSFTDGVFSYGFPCVELDENGNDIGEVVCKSLGIRINSTKLSFCIPEHIAYYDMEKKRNVTYRRVLEDTENYPDADHALSFAFLGCPQTIYVDNFTFNCTETLSLVNMSGTSMAAPVVTASAAILAKAFPEDSAAKRAARLIANVKPFSEKQENAENLCVSGGILSVEKALKGTESVPVLNTFTLDEATRQFTVNGFFFGSETGTLTLGEKACEVLSWDDETITAALPSDFRGTTECRVTASDGKTGRQFFRVIYRDELMETLPIPADDLVTTELQGMFAFDGAIYLPLYSHDGIDVWRFADEQWSFVTDIPEEDCWDDEDMDLENILLFGGELYFPVCDGDTFLRAAVLSLTDGSLRQLELTQPEEEDVTILSLFTVGNNLYTLQSDGALTCIDKDGEKLSDAGRFETDAVSLSDCLFSAYPATRQKTYMILQIPKEEKGVLYAFRADEDAVINAELIADPLFEVDDGYLVFRDLRAMSFSVSAMPNGLIISGLPVRDENDTLHDCFYLDFTADELIPFDKCALGSDLHGFTATACRDGQLYCFGMSGEETDNDSVVFFRRTPICYLSLDASSDGFTVTRSGVIRHGSIVVALYDEDGRVVAAKTYDASTTDTVSGDFGGMTGAMVKAFFLADDGVTPNCAPVSVTLD